MTTVKESLRLELDESVLPRRAGIPIPSAMSKVKCRPMAQMGLPGNSWAESNRSIAPAPVA